MQVTTTTLELIPKDQHEEMTECTNSCTFNVYSVFRETIMLVP